MNNRYLLSAFITIAMAAGSCTKEQNTKPTAQAIAAKPKHINVVPVTTGSLPQPSLSNPISGIVFTSNGTVYGIRNADHYVQTIFKYVNGVYTELLKTPAATADQYGDYDKYTFSRLVVDSKDNVYFAYVRDEYSEFEFSSPDFSKIMKLAPDGTMSVFAGGTAITGKDGNGTAATFGLIADINIDAYGNIYIIDRTYAFLRKITPNADVAKFATYTGSGVTIAADKLGNVYLGGTFPDGTPYGLNDGIIKYDQTGASTPFKTNASLYTPLVVDKYNYVWFASSWSSSNIYVMNSAGTTIATGSDGLTGRSLAFDSAGVLYYIGHSNIYRVVLQ